MVSLQTANRNLMHIHFKGKKYVKILSCATISLIGMVPRGLTNQISTFRMCPDSTAYYWLTCTKKLNFKDFACFDESFYVL
jgi:hypothetical protein